MKLHKTIVRILLAGVVFAAANAAVSAQSGWLRIESKNFQLIGNADEKSLRGTATRLPVGSSLR